MSAMAKEMLPVADLEMIDLSQQVEVAVREAETRLEIIQRVMQVALKATYTQDWIDMNDKPYLAATGAERLASLFGVTVTDMDSKRYEDKDERGNYYYFVVTGTAHFRGTSISVMGTCSARDPFFSTRYENEQRILLPAEAVDQPNIVKSAYSNMIANAVTRVLGIRGLTWHQLEQLGFDRKGAASVRFQDRKGAVRDQIADREGAEATRQRALAEVAKARANSWVTKLEALLDTIDGADKPTILLSITSFDKKDGGRFSGYDSIAAIRQRSKQPEKVAQIAHAKLAEQITAGTYTVKPVEQPAEEVAAGADAH